MVICTFVISASAFAQGSVTGQVTDAESGEVLPGVNVVITELQRGTATDADGNYTISNLDAGTYTLTATFIGYRTYSAQITIGSGQLTHNIEMQPDVVGLDDVVVTAFGIEREKRALGYGVSEVNSENITRQNNTDLARALSGQLPGVDVTASGGLTGSGTDIVIRGFTTITGNNAPLFIVDGVRFDSGNNASSNWFAGGGAQTTPDRFLDLNPQNIKDITVLKGLSATVLYGEEGRNGVILVTTKTGSFSGDVSGPGFQVTLDQSVYATQISSRPDYQNTYGGGFDQNFGWFFSNWGPPFATQDPSLFGSDFRGIAPDGTILIEHPLLQHGPTAQAFPELQSVDYRYEAKPDPIASFFGTGLASSTNLNIAGGTEDLRVNVGYSRTGEEGFTPNNNLNRNTFSVGASYQIWDDLSAQTTFNMSLTDVESPPSSAGGGSGPAAGNGTSGVFNDVFYTPRSICLCIPYTNPVTGGSAYYRSGNDIPHPRWTANNLLTANRTNRYYGKTELNWQAMDGLNVVYRLGYDSFTEDQSFQQNPGGVRPEGLLNGYFQTVEILESTWDHNLQVLLDYQLTEDISFNGTVGGQYTLEKFDRQGLESINMIIFDFFKHSNFVNQSSTNFFTGGSYQYTQKQQTAGIYADVTVGYQDFVYLNLAGRNDWFSTLEPENRSIFYPSASLSYIVSDHLDITNDWLTYLKLFAGVGSSAGSPGPYNTRNVLATDARAFIQPSGAVVTTNATSNSLGNPGLKPELHTEYEFGVDVRFLEGRIGLNAQYYTRKTTDLITSTPIDPATGFTSTLINIGEINNQGIEVQFSGNPVQGEFSWNTTANFYKNTSEVKSLGSGLDRIQVGGGFTTRGNFAIPGEPFMVMLGSQIERVTADMVQNDPNFSGVEVGTPLVNEQGNYITTGEIGVIGNPNPDWDLGWINTFRYKGASLTVQLDYQQGGDMFSTWISTLMARGLTTDTDKVNRNNTFILPGVNQQGEDNTVQISPSGVFFDNFGFGADELRVYDMTHIRLSNVSLSYDLPASVIGQTPFSQVTVSLSGDNLWMYAFNVPKGSGFDPNVNSIGGNSRGFEYLTGPQVRRFGGSIRVRF